MFYTIIISFICILNANSSVLESANQPIKSKTTIFDTSKIENILTNEVIRYLHKENIVIDIGYFLKHFDTSRYKDIKKISIKSIKIQSSLYKFIALLNLSKDLSTEVIEIKGRYYESINIPTIASNLPIGSKIKAEDIIWIKYPLKKMKKSIINHEKELIGKNIKRYIKAKSPIHKSHVESAKIIEKNDIVNMFYKSNFIKIKTLGIALENGKKGDLIRIKNESSDKIVQAIIINKNDVLVNLK